MIPREKEVLSIILDEIKSGHGSRKELLEKAGTENAAIAYSLIGWLNKREYIEWRRYSSCTYYFRPGVQWENNKLSIVLDLDYSTIGH